jgi:MoxR-like ATPase
VIPDDIKDIAEAVLAHRIVVDPEAEFDGVTANAIIAQILLQTVPPSGPETE